MDRVSNRRVLLISLRGYSDGIVRKMRDLDINVDYFNDKPNDGFICKACGRFKVKPYERVLNNYYKKLVESVKQNRYDYIIVIRGEYTPVEALRLFKANFSDAKLILYMWDSIANNKGIDKKWKYFDKVYTFDRIDYLNHKEEIDFLPLFFYEDYLPEVIDNAKYQYDVSFIGTGHEDRIKIVKQVEKKCKQNNQKFYSYIYMPHLFVYYYNKVFNKNFKGVRKKDIHFEKLPFEETYRIYSSSKCVMDVESSSQCGLTMRTIEMLGLKKKLVTTNKDIVNYDFYNSDNVMVVDRNDFHIDKEFFDKPYKMLDQSIYDKYSLESWIKSILR